MMMNNSKQILKDLFENNDNNHFPAGPLYSSTCKAKAFIYLEENELSAVYNLVESHAPALRFSAVHEYEKARLHSTADLPLSRDHVNFHCNYIKEEFKIKTMLSELEEMPKEWTIIQLTSQYNLAEIYDSDPEKMYTNPIYLTIMSCGKNEVLPFVTILEPPYDHIANKVIEVRQEMQSILRDNTNSLKKFKDILGNRFRDEVEKMVYADSRYVINNRVENVIKLMQDKWLGYFKCLLIGKYVNEEIEEAINTKIKEVLQNHNCTNITDKTNYILKSLVKGNYKYQAAARKELLHYLFPGEDYRSLRSSLTKMSQSLNKEHNLFQQLRHPVILIVDEKLDFLPWEMIDLLQDNPVCRMPSLHFTYAMFKENESSIENGLKIISHSGAYVINPGLDLKNMEIRLRTFFQYWLPSWNGLAGVKPSETDFKDLVTNNDIFIYSGHGNGTQFLAGDKIKKLKIRAVTLLFGCGSVQLQNIGPRVEMISSYQMYMIACSPCIVGMLWTVTDTDTDLLTTNFLSSWLPSNAEINWQSIDQKQWALDGKIEPSSKPNKHIKQETELLRALSQAKKSVKQCITKAACVVRGLPVKIV